MDNQTEVLEINKYICSQLWVDFEVVCYNQERLVIRGGVDLLYGYDIEITFENVFAVQGKFSWTISGDKVEKVVHLLYDVFDNRDMLLNIQPETGYHLFSFKIDNDIGERELFFYVFAESVHFCKTKSNCLNNEGNSEVT